MSATLVLLKQEIKRLLSLSSVNTVKVTLWDMLSSDKIVTNSITCDYNFYRWYDIDPEFEKLETIYNIMMNKSFDVHIRIVVDKEFKGGSENE